MNNEAIAMKGVLYIFKSTSVTEASRVKFGFTPQQKWSRKKNEETKRNKYVYRRSKTFISKIRNIFQI